MTKTLTTHILDLSSGRPAANVPVHVENLVNGQWMAMPTAASTNADGRAFDLVPADKWQPGRWRIIFDIASYMPDGFFPAVTIEFCTKDSAHYHVPLLLNKFGYSTYRGS
jgi:5-hydroxyisourate hydrolase